MILKEVRKYVERLLGNDTSGHGMDHIARVETLSLQFALKEKGDTEIVSLIALLHDVDDYKIFGEKNARDLTNTKLILDSLEISSLIKEQVIKEVACIGYHKELQGKNPQTLEGKIVSDVDKCDAIGSIGILRAYQYAIKHQQSFFDPNMPPQMHKTYDQYMKNNHNTVVNHLIEKILTLKDLMFTESGKEEALIRHQLVVDFLKEFFRENNRADWNHYIE